MENCNKCKALVLQEYTSHNQGSVLQAFLLIIMSFFDCSAGRAFLCSDIRAVYYFKK